MATRAPSSTKGVAQITAILNNRRTLEFMTTIVKNEPDKNQYTLWVDGHKAGSIEYKLGKSRITFIRTEIDSHYRNAGLGSVLVRNALDDVRVNSDRSLVPRCAFTAKWINKHPEYQELVNRTK